MAAGKRSIVKLLERHKAVLGQELAENSPLLDRLAEKGVLSFQDKNALLNENQSNVRGEVFVDIIAGKGFTSFRNLCSVLETEYPNLLTQLLLDSTGNSIMS